MIEFLCTLLGLFCGVLDTPPDTSPPALTPPAISPPEIIRPDIDSPIIEGLSFFDPTCEFQPPDNLKHLFVAAALNYPFGATQCELARQAFVESSFNIEAYNEASGAMGIAQFVPATAEELGIDPWEPSQAIDGMAEYVDWCRNRWTPGIGGRTHMDIAALGLCCYNWGLGKCYENQKRYGWVRYQEAAPYWPHETRTYVHKVHPDLNPNLPGAN